MDLGSSICTPKKPACALCPLNEDCAGASARRSGDAFRARRRRRPATLRRGAAFVVTRGDELAGAHAPRKRLARRHDRGAGLGLARRARRRRRAETGARLDGVDALASQGRRGHPRLHAFSAGACGLHRARAGAHPRAEGHALGADRDACRRSAAECDAQGDRAWAWY